MRVLGLNPLIRISDRLEALVTLAAIIAAIVAVPVATQVETEFYEAGVSTAEQQAHSRKSVDAIAVEGSTSLTTDFEGPAYVHVQWRDGTQLRSEQVVSSSTVEAGEPLRLWLDTKGDVVAAPVTADDAKTSAVLAAGMLWITSVVCCVVTALLFRRGLDRARDRAWERELHLMTHNDDGWANRHS